MPKRPRKRPSCATACKARHHLIFLAANPHLARAATPAETARRGFFAVQGPLITAALALNDWDFEAILPPGYDCTSASPDFANGAITGSFIYAAGTSDALSELDQMVSGLAPSYTDNNPALEALANNPTVLAARNFDWAASNPGGYIDQRREMNSFVRQDSAGTISIQNLDNSLGDYNTSYLPDPPGSHFPGNLIDALFGNKTLALIHTHPNAGDAESYGASPADQHYSQRNRIPLLIQSPNGLHIYDPGQH